MQEQQKAGGIIINDKGQVLIITNDLGRHTFPKGSVELGEDYIDTARREIREETGLTELNVLEELGVLTRQGFTDTNKNEPSVIKHIHLFYCTTSQQQLKAGDPEIIDARWVNPDELAYLLSWPEEVAFFEEQRAKIGL